MGWGGGGGEREHQRQMWTGTLPRAEYRGCRSELDGQGGCCMQVWAGYVPGLDGTGGALGRGPAEMGRDLPKAACGQTGLSPHSSLPACRAPSQGPMSACVGLRSLCFFSSSSPDCSGKAGSSERPPEPGGLGVTRVLAMTVEHIIRLSQSDWPSGDGRSVCRILWGKSYL